MVTFSLVHLKPRNLAQGTGSLLLAGGIHSAGTSTAVATGAVETHVQVWLPCVCGSDVVAHRARSQKKVPQSFLCVARCLFCLLRGVFILCTCITEPPRYFSLYARNAAAGFTFYYRITGSTSSRSVRWDTVRNARKWTLCTC